MSDKAKVYVAGVGMVTPVGFDAPSTSAAVRAGINQYKDTQFYNRRFEPMKMALVPDDALPQLNEGLRHLPGLTTRRRRMLRLAEPALKEVLSTLPIKDTLPLFLSGPETLPGCPKAIDSKFLQELKIQTGANIDLDASRIVTTGRAGGIQIVELAFKYFDMGKDIVLIGGIDTCFDQFMLGMLDNDDRISSESSMESFTPGEAAGFVLLVSERFVNNLPYKPLATLYRPGISDETGHRYSDEPYRGEGLSEAFKLALSSYESGKIKTLYTSLNGEHFSAKELGVAVIRNKNHLIPEHVAEHPADCFGDIGAAFGPVLIGLISASSPGNYLSYCSSETNMRAALTVCK